MSEPEELPNTDDSGFTAEVHQSEEHAVSNEHNQQIVAVTLPAEAVQTHEAQGIVTASGVATDQVYVATPHGYLTADQLHSETGIKTTHIVIHDQTLEQLAVAAGADPSLKTPTTPLPPPTPATPLSREKGFRYTWDDSAFNQVLPIRCKSSNGELHKARFGSGGRGRCIRMGDKWFTPSEYEAFCGRASSKDWKRSIRYGGRTLQCLIEDGILHPHATSCTCAACCDDESVTGPVRLFMPYKRRRKDTGPELVPRKKSLTSSPVSVSASSSPTKDSIQPAVRLVSFNNGNLMQPLHVTNAESGETIQIISGDASGNLTVGETVVMPVHTTQQSPPRLVVSDPQPVPQQQPPSPPPVDNTEHDKMWYPVEEMANHMLQQAEQFKQLVEQTKLRSIATRAATVQQLRAQMEKEKNEAINALRIEMQHALNRAMIEERAQKEICLQQALAQARSEMQHQDKMDTVTVVSADDKVTYNVTWAPAPQAKYQNGMDSIMDGDGEESDKDKE